MPSALKPSALLAPGPARQQSGDRSTNAGGARARQRIEPRVPATARGPAGETRKRWGCDASLGCFSIAADQPTHRDQAALPIWFTRPHLPLSNGSQPSPLDLRYEEDCRTKSTTARRKDSVVNVILKCDQWTPATGFKPSGSTPVRPFRTTPILRTVSPAASNFAVTPSAKVGRTMTQ